MVRQRFTAFCKTAMVSSITDSPSNLYKVLTVSTEFVTNFWKWSQYSIDHKKWVVKIFLKNFWSKLLNMQNSDFQSHFPMSNISKSFLKTRFIGEYEKLLRKTFFIILFFKEDLFSKMILPTSSFCGSKKFDQRCSKKFSTHFLWSLKY